MAASLDLNRSPCKTLYTYAILTWQALSPSLYPSVTTCPNGKFDLTNAGTGNGLIIPASHSARSPQLGLTSFA